jgi:hypothetical protein
MTTAYTSLLGLALPVTGELSGTWGDTVNTAITSLLDTAVAGTTSITTDADITLTTTTGASNQARQAIILWNPASGTTTRNITAPAQSKIYTVINASGGTQSVVIRGAGPTTGVTIAKGEAATVAWNGSDFVKVSSSGGAITFTDLTVTGNTILGDAAADTLTVNATSTFASPVSFQNLVRLPSTGRAAAAALTVTAPAFLYGVASTYTDTTSSGTIAAMAPFYSIAQPTLSTSNVTTYTNAATLYIAAAPAAGGSATITNPFALYVAAGANYFAGNSTFAANVTLGDAAADTLTVNSTITSNLIFTDNTYDIGASGATRPRSIYATGVVNITKAVDPLFMAVANSNGSAGLYSSVNNGAVGWFVGTRKDAIGGSAGVERWNLLYDTSNFMYVNTIGNIGFSTVPQGWATGIAAVQIGPVTALRGDTNSTYLTANFYQDSGGAKYINGSAYAGQYHIDQTGGSNGVHKWGIAPNTGTGGGALSLAVPMYLTPIGSLVLQSTALNAVTQLALSNVTGTTKNNQIIFSDSTNARWRVGTDIGTNNNTNNFQLYNDATASSAMTVDASSRFLFGAGFQADVTNGVIQARSAATGTSFISNPAVFGAINTVAGREVPGLLMTDGTNTTLFTQVGDTLGIYKTNNLAMTIYKSGSYANIGIYGAGGTPIAPFQINGAGVYAGDANSSYIGAGAGGTSLQAFGITGNYALRYWIDSATANYYWQSSSVTGTAGNGAGYNTLMRLNLTGLGVNQDPQSNHKLAVTGNTIINDGGFSVYTSGSDVIFQRSNTDAFPPAYLFRKSRGTYTSPTAVTSGDGLGITYYQGYDGSNFLFTGSLQFVCSGAVSANSIPTQFALGCGTSGNTTRMAVNTSGHVNIGGGTTYGVGQQLLVVGEGASSNPDQGTTLKVGTDNASIGGNATVQGIFCGRSANSGYRFLQMNSGTTAGGSFGDAEFIFYGDGNANADGTWNNNGADYAEFFESATGQELPVGTTVVLEGNKVRAATAQDNADQIMGVVRPKADGTASMVIGNTAWNKWNKKYLQDDFGVFEMESFSVVEWTETIKSADGKSQEEKLHSYEEDRIPAGVIVPAHAVRVTTEVDGVTPLKRRKLNPDWNPNTEYVPRKDRPEWMIIGLIGQIPALSNQPVNPRWTKMREISASVFEYFVR